MTKPEMKKCRNRCRHFTGIQNDKCELGISYAEVRDTGTRPYRFPCTDETKVTCEKVDFYSDQELADQYTEMISRLETSGIARAAIIESGKHTGPIDCPVCGEKESLQFSIARCNGHVHARCDTVGCVQWME